MNHRRYAEPGVPDDDPLPSDKFGCARFGHATHAGGTEPRVVWAKGARSAAPPAPRLDHAPNLIMCRLRGMVRDRMARLWLGLVS